MSIELITIKELLRDPQYREYFKKIPKLPPHYTPENLPWKLIILKKGETAWRSKKFGTYQEAFAGLKTVLPTIDNAAINCRPLGFMPPIRTVRVKGKYEMVRGHKRQVIRSLVWKPKLGADMEPHQWCPHCRRPTIFRYATRAVTRSQSQFVMPASEPALRCVICGVTDRIVDLRRPENNQRWDANRPRIY